MYKIPYGETSQELAQETFKHYISIIWEKPETGKLSSSIPRTKIGHDGPDHFFDTLVYCELAKLKESKKVKLKIIGNNIGKKKIEKNYYEILRSRAKKL